MFKKEEIKNSQLKELTDYLSEAFCSEQPKVNYHAVVFFTDTGSVDLNKKYVFSGVQKFNSGLIALNVYANTPCPASQLISASTEEELDSQILELKANFKDAKWVEENIEPYI